jgi:hypothetical protein
VRLLGMEEQTHDLTGEMPA